MKSYRPERVAQVVREVVSQAIATKLSDPRIEPLTSVTRVEVTRDLEFARVHVSVMADEAGQRRTMRGLEAATGRLQRMLARRLTSRQCPHLSFHLDQSLKRAADTLRLIDETMAEYEDRTSPGDAPADQDDATGSASAPSESRSLRENAGEDA